MKNQNLHQFLTDAAARSERSTESTRNPGQFPVLAVDYGEKFCGLAWSLDGTVVLPIAVVKTAEAKPRITELCGNKNICTLVFGLPVTTDGRENHVCAQIRAFAQSCAHLATVDFVDERGSSRGTIAKDAAQRIDDLAAVNILGYWLEG